MTDTYKREIIDPGDEASKLAAEVSRESYKNSNAVIIMPAEPGNFRGSVAILWKMHISQAMSHYHNGAEEILRYQMGQVTQNDGAGGKPQFFTLVGTPEAFAGLGREIIAMNADDLARDVVF